MAAERPAGTVTFLFADVDRSALPDRAPEPPGASIEALESGIRDVLGRHGGYVFATDHGSCRAAFATPIDAAQAAVELQRRLLAEPERTGLRVRVALHTGEADADESGYVGPEVDRAARLTAVAHGSQVLVSDTTELLPRSRMALRSLGEHRLRDLDRRMTVYQLEAEGLPSDFPALRSLNQSNGNLREQLTSLVGRDEMLREVADLVRANQLVTLGGAGGVGKTRLALEVGAGLAGEFADGVWFVDLASIGDPLSVPAAIATTLGVVPRADTQLIDAVAETLSGRRSLVVIDNCEHVLSAVAAAVGVILARSHVVRVLATSREYLWIAGETLVDVSPLALAGGVASDAVQLFVERARAVRPSFGLQDPQTADAVTEICRTLDGLPLGIELAAARMAAMSPIEVRDRLGARFRLLRAPASRPERQQTLLRAVGWSYDLLDADEQKLMRDASVFSGGFDLASISAVVGADDVEVLGLLDSLVGKSLIVADHGAEPTRYRPYETIRQFCEDRLAESGGLSRMRDRHAAHFAAEAAARWERWDGPGWRDAVDWVEAELGNLRTAFRWSSQRGQLEVATDIAAHAALMGISVELFETVGWAEELLDSAAAVAVPRLPRLYTAAGYACFVGRAEAATVNAHRAVELESQPGFEPCEPGYATFVEALGQVYCGHLDRYVELTGSVAAQFGAARGYGLASYVDGLQASGRVTEARELVDASIAAARDLGNPFWIAYALWIGGLALASDDRMRALAIWDEAVDHVREHRVHFFDGFLARDAARLHTSDGLADRALALFDTAVWASHQAGNVAQLVITLASVPALFERLDRVEAAMTLFGAMSHQPAGLQHVPELTTLGEQLTRRLGAERAAELRSTGAALDLNEAAAWTRDELGAARRELERQAGDGRPAGLSRREIDVLRLIAEGRTTGEIATLLFISPKTADHHIQHIYTKIGVSNRAAATHGRCDTRSSRTTPRADPDLMGDSVVAAGSEWRRPKWGGLPMPVRVREREDHDMPADRLAIRRGEQRLAAERRSRSHDPGNDEGRGRRSLPGRLLDEGRREARRARIEGIDRLPRPVRREPCLGSVRLGRSGRAAFVADPDVPPILKRPATSERRRQRPWPGPTGPDHRTPGRLATAGRARVQANEAGGSKRARLPSPTKGDETMTTSNGRPARVGIMTDQTGRSPSWGSRTRTRPRWWSTTSTAKAGCSVIRSSSSSRTARPTTRPPLRRPPSSWTRCTSTLCWAASTARPARRSRVLSSKTAAPCTSTPSSTRARSATQ